MTIFLGPLIRGESTYAGKTTIGRSQIKFGTTSFLIHIKHLPEDEIYDSISFLLFMVLEVSLHKRDHALFGDFSDSQIFLINPSQGRTELKLDIFLFAKRDEVEGVLKSITLDDGGDLLGLANAFEFIKFPKDRGALDVFGHTIGIYNPHDFKKGVAVTVDRMNEFFGDTVGSHDEGSVDADLLLFRTTKQEAENVLR